MLEANPAHRPSSPERYRGGDRVRELTELTIEHQKTFASQVWTVLILLDHRASHKDLEEVLVAAYLRAASRLRNGQSGYVANLRTWFQRVLHDECLEHVAKWEDEDWRVLEEIRLNTELLREFVRQQRRSGRLLALLRKPRDRDIIRLAAEGYTSREISNQLALHPREVRKRKQRGLSYLRQIVRGR